MAFQFPWTNLHELNLDWFLSKFKQFTNNYLGTTATAESVPNGTPPSVTVTGGDLDDDTDIVDPFTFNFKIPAGAQGEQGVQGIPGQDGFSPIATVTKTGTVATITITDANGTTTTTISDGEVTQAQLDTKAPAIMSSATGLIANFSDGADNLPMSELMVDIVPTQSGSGDPAPDNIRPISGWTGCNVTRTGKNLLPCEAETTTAYGVTYTVNPDGTVLANGTSTQNNRGVLGYGHVTLPAGTYIISGSPAGGSSLTWRIRVGDGSYAGREITTEYGSGRTFTLSETTSVYVRLYVQPGAGAVNFVFKPMIRLATNTDATYEPYQGTSVAVSWQTEAGTVYGGTLDVTSGLLTVTDGYIASYNGETLPSTWISDRDVYASGTTPTTGAEVVYKLATPQTYQLTPQQLFNTLYGVNNVWSDTGDSTVTYTADTMLYIQNLTQPTEDDMIANTSIANGNFFMIGNNLYRATTAIASGSQIIPGTNATPMSLADALNLL